MKRRDVSEADAVFRRSHTKNERTREMFFGQKKILTNLDFPFSQALVESGFSICLSKRSGGRGFAWLLSLTTRHFATKTRWMRERALLNNKRINNNNKKRINNNEKRINTITNDEIVTHRRRTNTDLSKRVREGGGPFERERSKSARAIWTFP